MASSFYNDEINDNLIQYTELINEADVQLMNLINYYFLQYVNNGKLLNYQKYSNGFDDIYYLNDTQKSKLFKAYRTQRNINETDRKETFDERGEKQVNDIKTDKSGIYLDLSTNNAVALSSLKLFTWKKLSNMISSYDYQINLLPKVGDEVD